LGVSKYPGKTPGKWIRRLRLAKGLFQRELAGLIGVEGTTILNWEKDRTKPEERHMTDIVSFFGMDEQLFSQLGK
jgi:repressor LexA